MTDPRASRPDAGTRRLSRAALYDLARHGCLDSRAFDGALGIIGIRPGPVDWARYWFHLLTLCGTLLAACGVIFFIAWNWNGLHHFVKFGILQALIAAGVLVAVWRGVDSVAGSAALLASGVCIGPLLAVFGQTYMSGAYYWELFRAWTCMLLPFAALGRQAALWLLVWMTAGVWGLGFMQHMSQSYESTYGLPEFLLLQMAAVAVWELAMRRARNLPGREWLRAEWLPRLMVFAIALTMTVLVALLIFEERSWREWRADALFLPFKPAILTLYAAGLALLYFWYRHKRRDLFMLGCGVFSACAVAVAAMIRAEVFVDKATESLLFWGLTIAGLTALCGKLLLHWQRTMEAEEVSAATADPDGTDRAARHLFGFSHCKLDWPELRARLVQNGLWNGDKEFPAPPPSGAPWYINAMLSAGGWVSALLLMGFLALLLFSTMDLNNDFEGPLFLGGAIFLGIGAFCSRVPGVFARQFGLASAIAGAVAAASALVSLADSKQYWSLPCLLVCLTTFAVIRNRAYRYIAAVFGVFFLYALLDALFWGTHLRFTQYAAYFGEESVEESASFFTPVLWGTAALWAALCAFLARGWQTESRWMTDRRFAPFMPPLLHGIFTAILLLLVASLALQSAYSPRELYLLLPPRPGFGLGAAVGFILLVFLLARDEQNAERQGAGFMPCCLALACALLTLPMGWFLPGVPLALLGFLISRQTGNAALLGASALFLAAYLFRFYYTLDISLLHKSFSLMACGLVLLAMATLLRRAFVRRESHRLPDEKEGEARHA